MPGCQREKSRTTRTRSPSRRPRRPARAFREALLPARSFRMQRELLHSPVVHVRDEDRVLIRTGDRMRPVELAHTPPGLAQDSENLSVESHLIEPPGLVIDGEQ